MIIYNVNEYLSAIQDITHHPETTFNDMINKLNKKESKLHYGDEIVYNTAIYNEHLKILNNISSNNEEKSNVTSSMTSVSQGYFKFFYRGHYKRTYQLLPSVFRDNDWSKEDFYYHEIVVQCPEKFSALSHLDKLVLMQHYECPTRLLDITSNPLVALFFACKNFGCKKCSTSSEGVVYAFPKLTDEISYSDSDRARMLACLPKFNIRDKMALSRECLKYIDDEEFPIDNDGRYHNNAIERFFYEVTTEIPSFKRTIKPLDLLRPLFIQPNKTNGRIIAQNGAFILNGLSNNSEEAKQKLEKITSIKLRIKNQNGILRELESLGIHEASLFPEIDKVANYLRDINL